MKKAIFFLALVVGIITISCKENSSSEKATFLGKWKIDSIQSPDTSSMGTLLLAMAFKDSASHHFEFTKDSIIMLTMEEPEKSDWTVDEEKKQLHFSKGDTIRYAFTSGTRLQLTGPDSTVIFLVKK